jgi:predicted phosphoadenosine phosphosulfate sulfurtransferase
MNQKIKSYINKWKKCGYDEIPEEIPLRIFQLDLAPSYKSICILLLNNEFNIDRSKKSIWYSELKRIELTQKGKIKINNQLKLKL